MTAAPAHRQLVSLLRGMERLSGHATRNPLDYVRWTEPQHEYLSSTASRKLLRLGNGGGKSYVALADVALRAKKAHPFRPDWNARRGPQHQWVVTYSWSQAVPLMGIFREFIGSNDLISAPSWDAAKGWGKAAPTLVFRDGSTVGWRTTRQGPLAHAGAKPDHVLIDEPCSVENYRELERRVFRQAGDLSLALTPVNGPGGGLQWLRDLATDGLTGGGVQDIHCPMNERLFRYTDGTLRQLVDGTICNEAWIAEQSKAVPAQWREIVLEGGWDEIVTDGTFSETFSPAKHVADFKLDGTEIFSLGNDHGSKAFTETAVLIAVDESGEYPHVYVLDCYEATQDSPADADARAILAMLKGQGLTWSRLKRATGDIAHYGGRGRINRKSNAELSYEIARQLNLGKNQALNPPIWTAKTGKGSGPRGSTYRGVSWLHRALLRPGQITIHPRCVSLIEAFQKFRGGSEDPYGHLIDALRYALDHWINRGQTRSVARANVIIP